MEEKRSGICTEVQKSGLKNLKSSKLSKLSTYSAINLSVPVKAHFFFFCRLLAEVGILLISILEAVARTGLIFLHSYTVLLYNKTLFKGCLNQNMTDS